MTFQELQNKINTIKEAVYAVYDDWVHTFKGINIQDNLIEIVIDYSEDYRGITHTLNEDEFNYSKEELILKFQAEAEERMNKHFYKQK